ncbi:MAG TPA: hypothetical protein VFX06_17545 [Stellaceae bacterium]|nr:hypothetical protein [Stellaceae bacterium]
MMQEQLARVMERLRELWREAFPEIAAGTRQRIYLRIPTRRSNPPRR